MFSGEIGSLQPRTSYAVAQTIGSREMAQHSPLVNPKLPQSRTGTFRRLASANSTGGEPIRPPRPL